MLTTNKTTLGTLVSYDRSKFYFTLEDGPSPHPYGLKVPGETRIPAGEYALGLARGTPLDRAKTERWPQWHRRGLIWIQDVPGFDDIRIHEGNTYKDTAGCPLVGFSASRRTDEPATLGASVDAYKDLYSWLTPMLASGMQATIMVADEPEGP